MIVGLTGSIATGKSTVTAMLRELGAYVIDADEWARRVVAIGTPGLRDIVDTFGEDMLHADGSLNRPMLGQVIFGDAAARQRLNEITHPRVREGMKQETLARLKTHPNEPVVWDVPLLLEGETQHLVNLIVLVYTDEETQLKRLIARDGISETDARTRIASQIPVAEKRKHADIVIDNSGDTDHTRKQVIEAWGRLTERAKSEKFDLLF